MLASFYKQCQKSAKLHYCDELMAATKKAYAAKNGNQKKWQEALTYLHNQQKSTLCYTAPYLHINSVIADYQALQHALKKLIPWRKGPFKIGDLSIDSEWRGDLKWERVLPHIQSLKGKTILDVGAGNGYFTFRMALAGAKLALGIEPFLLFNYQFLAIQSLIKNPPNAFVLPLRLEQMQNANIFDMVFSMGVLYHQKDYAKHLSKLKNMLSANGHLILETLLITKKNALLLPKNRYAKMRNVYHIPSPEVLITWLQNAGFKQIKLVNINQTSTKEQRASPWIGENAASLKDFLNPNNPNLTLEGYPAPQRAIFICSK